MLTDGVIRLRPIEREDLLFLRDLANDPVVRENVVGWDWPLSLAGQERWFANGIESDRARRFLIERADDDCPLGVTGLWDIDWRSRNAMSAIKLGGGAEVRGRGYGTRAINLTTAFAFEDVGLHRLHAQILSSNEASLRLYRDSCGWTVEGVARQHAWRGGTFVDLMYLGLLHDEYRPDRRAPRRREGGRGDA